MTIRNTAAPWYLDERKDCIEIRSELDGFPVAQVSFILGRVTEGRMNASLLREAPVLLSVLKKLIALVGSSPDPKLQYALCVAKTVIHSAEGLS